MKNPNAIYQGNKPTSKLRSLLNEKDGSKGSVHAPSIVEDEPQIEFEYRELSKEQALKLCVPHKDNQRCWDRLTMGAVADIYPSIVDAGFNTELAEAVEVDGKLHILKGLRRLFSVTHAPRECIFRLLVSKNMSDKDQFERARTGDIYERPNILDIGFRLSDMYKGRGEGLTMEQMAAQEGMAVGKVSEAISFTKFPDFIYGSFPGLRYIRYQWLRYLKAEKEKLPALEGRIAQVDPEETYESVEAAEKYSEEVFSEIKKLIQEKAKKPENNSHWASLTPNPDFNISVKGDKVSVKFDLNKVDKDTLGKLEEILKR